MAFGEKAIAFYGRHGIDPRDKLIVFSDGLELGTIVKLADHFAGRIRVGIANGLAASAADDEAAAQTAHQVVELALP